jgi:RNA polymerase sigma-70 factor (sigma-E family)
VDAESKVGFGEFAQARFQQLRTLAYVTCGDWQIAEDAVSGALSRLYLRWEKVASPDAYARTAVIRAAVDQKRRPWRRERTVGDAFPDVAVPDQSGDVDERLRMRAALRQVPPRQRATLVLRFLEGLSVEETAEVLECSPGTVKSQTKRGLDTLRTVLAAEITEKGDDHVVSHRGRA